MHKIRIFKGIENAYKMQFLIWSYNNKEIICPKSINNLSGGSIKTLHVSRLLCYAYIYISEPDKNG